MLLRMARHEMKEIAFQCLSSLASAEFPMLQRPGLMDILQDDVLLMRVRFTCFNNGLGHFYKCWKVRNVSLGSNLMFLEDVCC
jgi:hypothetical protein